MGIVPQRKQFTMKRQISQHRKMKEEYEPEVSQQKKWTDLMETVVVDFFSGNKVEKISLDTM